MPKLLFARAARDAGEERQLRKLAGARHAPGDWIMRARVVVSSWDGMPVPVIAERLGCHPETVRRRLHRFNAEGIDGLGDRLGPIPLEYRIPAFDLRLLDSLGGSHVLV